MAGDIQLWKIDYYTMTKDSMVIHVTIPAKEFQYVQIDDVKKEWISMIREILNEEQDLNAKWEMRTIGNHVEVIITVSKETDEEPVIPKRKKKSRK